jgi:hypothetical protein
MAKALATSALATYRTEAAKAHKATLRSKAFRADGHIGAAEHWRDRAREHRARAAAALARHSGLSAETRQALARRAA